MSRCVVGNGLDHDVTAHNPEAYQGQGLCIAGNGLDCDVTAYNHGAYQGLGGVGFLLPEKSL